MTTHARVTPADDTLDGISAERDHLIVSRAAQVTYVIRVFDIHRPQLRGPPTDTYWRFDPALWCVRSTDHGAPSAWLLRLPDLIIAATAELHQATVLHYDAGYDHIARITGQAVEWVAPKGSL